MTEIANPKEPAGEPRTRGAAFKALPVVRHVVEIWRLMKRRRGAREIFLILAGVLAAVFLEDPLRQLVNGHENPYVLVLMTEGAEDFTIPRELKAGMIERGGTVEAEGGRQIEIRQSTAPKGRTAEILESKCLRNSQCLAVVGGSNSTETKVILEALLDYDEGEGSRPSLIMPIATADSLTVAATGNRYRRLLRLVPNNLNQARRIRSFVSRNPDARNVLIIKDNQNSTYANDLTESLIQSFRGVSIDPALRPYEMGMVAGLRSDELTRSEYIIFVGDATTGRQFVEDLKRYDIKNPVIFTDGNTVAEVVREASRLSGPAYFLTPVRELTDLREPGYTAIGRDTFEIIRTITGMATSLDRDGFADVIENRVNEIILNPGAAGNYSFGADGENRSMEFHIFTMSGESVRFVRF